MEHELGSDSQINFFNRPSLRKQIERSDVIASKSLTITDELM